MTSTGDSSASPFDAEREDEVAAPGAGAVDPTDMVLAECIEDILRTSDRGEVVTPETYRERLGDSYGEFLEILREETDLLDSEDSHEGAKAPTRVFGDYVLEEELGLGGGGTVYRAHHQTLGRTVALKLLHAGFPERARERFHREARACAKLEHPQIVRVYDAGEVDGQLFYTMTLVEGDSLESEAGAAPLRNPRVLCSRMAELAEAIHAMHGMDVIHRDIKPANILLGPDGRLILADFGLARVAEDLTLTETGETLGTPFYMSPEQLHSDSDHPVDHRADVYGLGVTIFELLTGRPPFQPDPPRLHALFRMILSERPPSPSSLNPDVPRDVERIVLKCLEKAPADRYENAMELAADLRRFTVGEAVGGRPVSRWERGRRALVRHWRMAALAAVAVGVAVAWVLLAPQRAMVVIESVEAASVSLNGGPFQDVPVRIEVERGVALDIDLKAEGFRPARIHSVADAESIAIRHCLYPGPGATAEVYHQFELCMGTLEGAAEPMDAKRVSSSSRSGSSEYALPIYPRGLVRLGELPEYRLEIGEEFYGEGPIRFWIDGAVVAELEAVESDNTGPIPDAVLVRLKPGVTVEWGLDASPPRGAPRASFEIARVELEEELTELGASLSDAPVAVRTYFEAQLLAKHGLFFEAYLRLRLVREGGAVEPTPLLLEARMLDKLLMGIDEPESTRAWGAVRDALEKLPQDGAAGG